VVAVPVRARVGVFVDLGNGGQGFVGAEHLPTIQSSGRGSVTSAAELPQVGSAHRYVVVGVLETTRRLVLAWADEPGG
jgi:hypothetical protein